MTYNVRGPNIDQRTEGVSAAVEDAIGRVEWYFGELIDIEAERHPVKHEQLVTSLAKLDVAARRRESFLRNRSEPIRHPDTPGRVVELPVPLWNLLEGRHEFSTEEIHAARSVHQRMAESLAEERVDSETALFVFSADPAVE